MPKFATVWTEAGLDGLKIRTGMEQMGTPA